MLFLKNNQYLKTIHYIYAATKNKSKNLRNGKINYENFRRIKEKLEILHYYECINNINNIIDDIYGKYFG